MLCSPAILKSSMTHLSSALSNYNVYANHTSPFRHASPSALPSYTTKTCIQPVPNLVSEL